MREALLIAILGAICVGTLFRGRIGLYGYLWFSLMRPDLLAWGSPNNNYSFILALFALLGAAVSLPAKMIGMARNVFVLLLLVFAGVVTISTYAAIDPSIAWPQTNLFLRIVMMSLCIVVVIDTAPQVRWLVLLMGVSTGLLGAKFGFFGIVHPGVRYALGYGGMIPDNNAMAVAFAMGVPLLWYATDMVRRREVRLLLYGLAFLNIVAVALTYSRGGALAMGGGMLLIASRSRHKMLTMGLIVIVGIGIAAIAGQKYLDRLSTIQAPAEESSAESRLVLAKIGLRIWRSHPILGVGYGRTNQQLLMPSYAEDYPGYEIKVLHNTWIQTLVDCGIIGFLSFAFLFLGTVVWLGRSIRLTRKLKPEYLPYPIALQTSLIVFGIGCTFLSITGYDFLYFLLMGYAAWRNVYQHDVAPLAVKWVPQPVSVAFRRPLVAPRQYPNRVPRLES